MKLSKQQASQLTLLSEALGLPPGQVLSDLLTGGLDGLGLQTDQSDSRPDCYSDASISQAAHCQPMRQSMTSLRHGNSA